ncbi:hypothetical protein Taro_040118 [Colocasia esculenta]|uniref:Auxin-responsive protein SAUR32 n=1 Tax=Colocasia esculenta TaxID=4460 RepID=A0A843WKV9_COLES|nr:hypothetical protein [Colocasia esculenta]
MSRMNPASRVQTYERNLGGWEASARAFGEERPLISVRTRGRASPEDEEPHRLSFEEASHPRSDQTRVSQETRLSEQALLLPPTPGRIRAPTTAVPITLAPGWLEMGSGDSHLLHALRHHLHGVGGTSRKEHQHHNTQALHIPKGCLAVMVGQEGEEQQRFVVPVAYLSHPLFMQLLKDAEDEYGFDHKGAIALPCHVEEFRCVQGLIDRERLLLHHHDGGGHHHLHLHLHLHHIPHNLVGCFRA